MIQTAINFLNDAGWLANFLAIAGFLGTCSAVLYKIFKTKLRAGKIEHIVPVNFENRWTKGSGKAIARIAIVDDQPADFPTAELKADGYQVQTYRQVSLATTEQLATYDIVFLDMKGVVKDDPEMGGMKLIAELRRLNPNQKICAVSSKTFDINATEFFRQADDAKKKPLTAQECRAVIDTFLTELFSPKTLVASATEAVAALPREQRIELVSRLKQHRDGTLSIEQLAQFLTKVVSSPAKAQALINLGRAVAHAAK